MNLFVLMILKKEKNLLKLHNIEDYFELNCKFLITNLIAVQGLVGLG